MRDQQQQRERFEELVRSFGTAMLVTHGKGGKTLHARPMGVASVGRDGDLWFATGINSVKTEELLTDRRVVVVMQDPSRFVSITGEADLVVNRAKAAELWSEAFRPWFPKGPDDPELVLVHVRSHEAEYWDMRGLKGARYLFEAVQHAVRGERMTDAPPTVHGTVPLPGRPQSPLRGTTTRDLIRAAIDLVRL